MGLLDDFSSFIKTPEGMGLLSATFGGLAGMHRGAPLNSIGRAGMSGLIGYSNAQDQQAQLQQAGQLKDLRQFQIDQEKRRQEALKNLSGRIPADMAPLMDIAPETVVKSMFRDPVKPELITVDTPNGPMQRWVTPGASTGTDIGAPPPKPESTPSAIQEYNFAKGQGYKGTFQDFQLSQKRAGASNVTTNVMPPQKLFENEDKLRDNYRSEPMVKNAAEMQNAFNVIDTAYKTPSAANDLAMATKYMKVLDPTSVVRESEFALAVNATGLLDKVYNYANAIKTGQRLNPTQRKDFYDSAKAINDSFQMEKDKVGESYKGLAKQYGFKPENVIFQPSGMGNRKYNPATGRIE